MNKKLIGKWEVICWKINTSEGWKQLENYSDGQLVWDFSADGKLIEGVSGERASTTKYYFYPDESLLAIDRSNYADDGYILACIEDHCRVEFLDDHYMILYDLEDVSVEPDDYTLKMELGRMKNIESLKYFPLS